MGNWNLTVNVAGVKPFEPGSMRIPEGAYAVQIVDSDLAQKDPSKSPSLAFDIKVVEAGEAQGMTGKVFLSTDLTKDFNKKHLRSLLLGVGASPAALDNGNVNIEAAMFVGKTAYIFVEAREGEVEVNGKMQKQYDNRNFIAPAFYEKWKAEHAAGAAKPAGATAQPAAPAAGLGLGAPAAGAPAPQAGFAGGALFGR